MKIQFSVDKKSIDQAYEEVLASAVKQTQLKGFRKGQAPKNLVEQHVGQAKLQQQAIERAIPSAFTKEVNKQKLQPLGYPKINLKDGKPGEDFTFEAEVATRPEIKLGDYKKLIKGKAASSKIWTPEKGDKPEQKPDEQEEQDKLIDDILKTLMEKIDFKVPALLVEQEVDRLLSRLLDQINRLGLDLDNYLASTGKTREDIRKDYEATAETNLKLEFLLQELSEDLKIEITEAEIDDFIKVVGDEQARAQLNTQMERANLRMILTKRKTIDELVKLAA